jgi:hypothetical protein
MLNSLINICYLQSILSIKIEFDRLETQPSIFAKLKIQRLAVIPLKCKVPRKIGVPPFQKADQDFSCPLFEYATIIRSVREVAILYSMDLNMSAF